MIDNGGILQIVLTATRLVRQKVTAISFVAFDFAGSENFETLGSSLFGLHFRHGQPLPLQIERGNYHGRALPGKGELLWNYQNDAAGLKRRKSRRSQLVPGVFGDPKLAVFEDCCGQINAVASR